MLDGLTDGGHGLDGLEYRLEKVATSQSRFRGVNVISLTVEYALRAMVYLGREARCPTTTPRIAAGTQVPAKYLTKVMRALTTAGLAEARRGPDGGHTLARSPADLTVLDVIKAVETRRRTVPCPLCRADHPCALHRRLDEANELTDSLFRQTALDQLIFSEDAGDGRERDGCPIAPGLTPRQRADSPIPVPCD